MSSTFLAEAPEDATVLLGRLEGSELLFYFRSLPWTAFLKSFVANLPFEQAKALLISLRSAFKNEFDISISIDVIDVDHSSVDGEFLEMYLTNKPSDRSVQEVVQDIFRTNSASDDLEDRRAVIAGVLDAEQLQEAEQKSLLPISKALQDIGLQCDEVSTKAGKPSSFYTSKMRPRDAAKRLLSFWSANVSISSVPGFVGRAFCMDLTKREELFRANWDEEMISDLDATDARFLCGFLSSSENPSSPSAATCRRQLSSLLKNERISVPVNAARNLAPSQEDRPKPARADRAVAAVPPPLAQAQKPSGVVEKHRKTAAGGSASCPPNSTNGREANAQTVAPLAAHAAATDNDTKGEHGSNKKAHGGVQSIPSLGLRNGVVVPPASGVEGATVSGGARHGPPEYSSSSSSSDCSASEGSSSSGSRRKRRKGKGKKGRKGASDSGRTHTHAFCHLPAYRSLPKAMRKILCQGGVSLWELFEPLSLEITTPAELSKLQRYSNKCRQVVGQICRAKGLDELPDKCELKLESGPIRRIHPNERINQGVTFAATTWIAPRELARILQHGELKTWLEATVSRAGPLHIDSQDGHLAREILATGLTLAALIDEFHPRYLLQSAAVERLVRRLVIYEKSLTLDKKVRGAYLIKHMEFMGLGAGATPETESVLGA